MKTRSRPERDVTSLVTKWRERADSLDRYAQRRRRERDPREAEDAEQTAIDYRIAADELEGLPS